MKWLIASDIHGSAYYCERLLEVFKKEKADRIALLGDILYHGPRNDLPKEYAPKKVIQMLNEYKDKILCVRGNCDAEVDQMVLEFPIMSEIAVIENEGSLVYLTHGHKFNIDNPLPMQAGDTCIYGHFHVPLDEVREGVRFLNPGSISLPKMDSKHGYIILDSGKFTFGSVE